MSKKIILGIDVSSTCVGYSIIEYDKKIKLINYDHFKPIKSTNIFERMTYTQDQIKSIIDKYKPDEVAIEDIAKMFSAGGSSAGTIITLASFNRAVGLICHQSNLFPYLYNVMSIRHGLKKYIKLEKLPKKEEMPNVIENILNIKYDWLYNRNDKPKTENYDRADAIAVGLYHILFTNKLLIK